MLIRQLTPEESAALDHKYGKPLGPIGSIRRNPAYPQYKEPKINRDRYMEMKEQGMTDREICKEIHVNSNTLCDWKRQWMISRTVRVGRKTKEKGECKLCKHDEFVKGLCKQHYYKQWRWNHAH